MNTVHNPSGCMSIRIRRAHRPTLLQRVRGQKRCIDFELCATARGGKS